MASGVVAFSLLWRGGSQASRRLEVVSLSILLVPRFPLHHHHRLVVIEEEAKDVGGEEKKFI